MSEERVTLIVHLIVVFRSPYTLSSTPFHIRSDTYTRARLHALNLKNNSHPEAPEGVEARKGARITTGRTRGR